MYRIGGSALGKEEFLRKTSQGPDVADYRLEGVHVRIYGSAALVQATGLFTRSGPCTNHTNPHFNAMLTPVGAG